MITITKLRELLAKATPGPWSYVHRGSGDAPLIVAAINALPKLLDVYDQALAMVQPIENSPESPLCQFYRRREALSMAVYKLENAK